jgi:hypothetical protein
MVMKRIIIYSACVLFFTSCSAQNFNQLKKVADDYLGENKPLTSGDVASGLKEALIQGISKGSSNASQLDGYFKNPQIKIPFPPDAQKVADKLRAIGLGGEIDKFVLTLNRGAEAAAKEAKPIFVTAITSMTIEDAWAILKGEQNAATNYLKKTTSTQLTGKFKPVISNSLNEVSATKYYGDLVEKYNKIPFVEKVNPDLDDYATELAIDGLFTLIAKEELNIRKDPLARGTDLLKRVFGSQK